MRRLWILSWFTDTIYILAFPGWTSGHRACPPGSVLAMEYMISHTPKAWLAEPTGKTPYDFYLGRLVMCLARHGPQLLPGFALLWLGEIMSRARHTYNGFTANPTLFNSDNIIQRFMTWWAQDNFEVLCTTCHNLKRGNVMDRQVICPLAKGGV